MDEVENTGEITEIAAPETSQQETPQVEAKESYQDRNWREMRRAKDELERKAKMQEELIAELLNHTKKAAPAQEVDELANIPADDYIPKGQVEKLLARSEKKSEAKVQEAVEMALRKRDESQFLDKLKGKFSDFNDVVTPETLELLEQQDPELAETIAGLKDPYKIGLQSYKYIKSLGLSEKVPANRRVKEVEKKIEQNSKTVQSPQAFDKRPMAQTFQMTETMKKDLYKEMMGHANLAGGVPYLG